MMKKVTVRLYTRPGCHLCQEMLSEMLAAGCADEYELEEIDIDPDPELKALYGYEIPVLTINGRKAFKYRLTAAEFKRRIRATNQE